MVILNNSLAKRTASAALMIIFGVVVKNSYKKLI